MDATESESQNISTLLKRAADHGSMTRRCHTLRLLQDQHVFLSSPNPRDHTSTPPNHHTSPTSNGEPGPHETSPVFVPEILVSEYDDQRKESSVKERQSELQQTNPSKIKPGLRERSSPEVLCTRHGEESDGDVDTEGSVTEAEETCDHAGGCVDVGGRRLVWVGGFQQGRFDGVDLDYHAHKRD